MIATVKQNAESVNHTGSMLLIKLKVDYTTARKKAC